jgi:hypothetical protein
MEVLAMDFFVLDKPESGTVQDHWGYTVVMNDKGINVGQAPRCPSCGGFTGLLPWLPPFRIEVETWGKQYGDIMRVGEDLIVSERCMNIFRLDALKGFCDFAPVEIVKVIHRRGKPKEKCPTYFKASVVKSPTTVDQEASGMQWAPTIASAAEEREWNLGELECPICLFRRGVFVRQKRLVLQEETWTGEDIFHARGGVNFVVTSRFKDVCEKNDIKNARFIPAEEYEVDYYPSESKQLLRYLRTWENQYYDREIRQNAYRTLASVAGRPIRYVTDFDPDVDIDSTIIEAIRARLVKKGVL